MADARLWSFITNTHDFNDRLMEWLKRSKDHPLRVRYTLSENDLQRQVVFPGITQKIKDLHLSGHFKYYAPFFGDVQSLPLLQRLKVECRNTADSLFRIPEFIFEGNAGLHDIDIRGHAIIQTAHLTSLRNLTRLHLEFSTDAAVLPSLSDLLQTLRQSPALQYLGIHESVTSDGDGEVTFNGPVSLTLLQDLRLQLDVVVMDLLLQAIKIPPATYLSLTPRYIQESYGLSSHFTHLLVWIGQHFCSKGAPFLRSVRLRADGSSHTVVSAHHTSECPSLFNHEARPRFLIIVHPSTQLYTRKLLTKILYALPIRHEGITLDATEIMSGGKGGLTEPSWKRIFECIPVPMVINAGNNAGTSAMLSGLLAAMKTLNGPKKLKDRWGVDLRLLRLVINASMHPHYFGTHPDVGAPHSSAYRVLVELLTLYQALDVPWKRTGRRIPSLEVTGVSGEHPHVYQFCRELWEVSDELILEGKDWHPVKIRNDHKRFIKRMKERRAQGKDIIVPLSTEDENLSEEEPILPRQTQEAPKKFSDRIELFPDGLKHMHEEEFGKVMV